jgi:DNA-directed RNA polymerase beta subunit
MIDAKKAKELKEKAGGINVPIKPVVTSEVIYLDAFEEEKYITTTANVPMDENGYFLVDKFQVRKYGQPATADVSMIDFVGVAANQIVSVATSLIPFMEHDDGQRTLMGTNMQRQAVPLVVAESPIVGTGIESRAALDSGHVIVAQDDGEITKVDAGMIEMKDSKGKTLRYDLTKFLVLTLLPASISIRQSMWGKKLKKAMSCPTAPRSIMANWPWVRTFWSPS